MHPLVVDLDGTLIRSDLMVESTLTFVRSRPATDLMRLVWLAPQAIVVSNRGAHDVG